MDMENVCTTMNVSLDTHTKFSVYVTKAGTVHIAKVLLPALIYYLIEMFRFHYRRLHSFMHFILLRKILFITLICTIFMKMNQILRFILTVAVICPR